MEGPTMLADSIAQLQQLVPQLAADVAAGEQAQAAALAQLTAAQATIASDEAKLAVDAATIASLQAQIAAVQQQAAPMAGFGKLAWHDEFDGPLDSAKWNVANGVAAKNERSIRWARNVTVAGGSLVIQPRLETTTAGSVTRPYTSGWVDTGGKFAATPPFYLEFRAQLPLATGKAAGMWPAGWMRGVTGAGEVDVFEFFELGPDATASAIKEAPHGKMTSHIYSDTNTGAGKAGAIASTPIDGTAWHVYGCRVDPDCSVTTFLDGALFKAFPVATYPYLATAFAGGYRLIVNLQIGSAYYGGADANTDWSQAFRTDYVRVWTP